MQDNFDIRSTQNKPATAERDFENALRPLSFSDFTGQKKVVENLKVFVEAARMRGEPLDHTLLHGPPGLGKTTLSNIIANELGVGFKLTSGPVLDKPGDLGYLYKDTTVTYLGSLYKYRDWAYIDTWMEGHAIRAFVPMDCISIR